MNINILKKPEFENDSYLMNIEDFTLNKFQIEDILNKDPYLRLKHQKFISQDISKNGFEEFLNKRESLRSFNDLDSLPGSIYTYSVGKRNNATYNQVLQMVKEIRTKNPNSRRAVVRMANPIQEYRKAEFEGYDVSCLNLIHYLNGQINLVFRSSDIEYELFNDIITLYDFFIKPIYGESPITIQIYGSTGQKINKFEDLINKLKEAIK